MKSLQLVFIIALLLLARVRCSSAQYVIVSARTTVEPGFPVMSECSITMDAATFSSSTYAGGPGYPGVAANCFQFANGVPGPAIPPALSNRPQSSTAGMQAWSYPGVYDTELDGFIFFSSNGGEYLDPLGYLDVSAVPCSLIPVAFCPIGFFFNPAVPYVQFTRVGYHTNAPEVPVIEPQSATLSPGGMQQFRAFAANSGGSPTATPASVTWSILGNAHGSITQSGLYIASSTETSQQNTDTIQASSPNGYKATASVSVLPQAPPPYIAVGAGACTSRVNSVQNVLAGQLISLVGCIPSSFTGNPTSESWLPSMPSSGVAVGSFSVQEMSVVDPTSGRSSTQYAETIKPLTPTTCGLGLSCAYNNFYFTAPGSYTFQFTYGSNGNFSAPAPASVTFVVTAPSPSAGGLHDGISGIPGTPVILRQGDTDCHGVGGLLDEPYLSSGEGNGNCAATGMKFQANYDPLGGNYIWAQLLAPFKESDLMHSPSPPLTQTGLDTGFPYADMGATTNDTPQVGLSVSDPVNGLQYGYLGDTTLYEVTYSAHFQMYLLWQPPADASCSPSSICTIIVPLGYLPWEFNASAYNTLDSNQGTQGWVKEPCSRVVIDNIGIPGSLWVPTPGAYPVWNNTVHGT